MEKGIVGEGFDKLGEGGNEEVGREGFGGGFVDGSHFLVFGGLEANCGGGFDGF